MTTAARDVPLAFATFPQRLAAAVRTAAGRPVPRGEWTPEQVVRHLIAVEIEVHQRRFDDLDHEPSPQWSWAEPGPWPGDPGLSLGDLLARFGELRASTIATVQSMEDADWGRSGVHATYGRLDVAGLLRIAAEHDEEHLAGLR